MIFGSYFNHIKSAWNRRFHPNFLFIFYEDLVNDLPAQIRKISDFLDKPLLEKDVPNLINHLQFNNFKHNKSVNLQFMMDSNLYDKSESFIRRGKIGGNPEMTEEIADKIDEWTKENLKETDLKFPV